jgi:hypothetical protein
MCRVFYCGLRVRALFIAEPAEELHAEKTLVSHATEGSSTSRSLHDSPFAILCVKAFSLCVKALSLAEPAEELHAEKTLVWLATEGFSHRGLCVILPLRSFA